MTNPDELERAVAAVDGFVQRWESRIGTGAQTGDTIYCVTVNGFEGEAELRASDLRLILAANRKMRKALSELCENAELARFHIGNTEGGDIVGSALWDTIGQARSALSTKDRPRTSGECTHPSREDRGGLDG